MGREPHEGIGVLSTMAAMGELRTLPLGEAATVLGPEGEPERAGRGRDDEPAPPSAPMGPSARYHVLGVLGEGGMGRVDEVWDADLMRALAVKCLHPRLREKSTLVRQFLWEARVTAHLDHPNIIPLHDLGIRPDGSPYFTMKRARGRSLEAVVKRLRAGDVEGWPLQRRLRVMLQLCEAIAFAHAHGVLHRDLKPGNVMIGDHGEVLVMDWGLAVPLDDARGESLRQVIPDGVLRETSGSGTPLYMSPEQAAREPVTERSDVYTLGVMLYELASLHLPYDGSSVGAILERIRQGDAVPIERAWPEVSPSLAAVVGKAMALDPAERYGSVSELRQDLELVVDGRTPAAEHASMLRRAGRFYVGRSRALGKLTPLDIDLISWSAFLCGLAFGALGAGWLRPWWLAILAVATIFAVPPMWRWYRAAREPD